MAATVYAVLDDVAIVYDGAIPNSGQAQYFLDYTQLVLQQKVADVDLQVAAGTLDPDLVRNVVIAAVMRLLRNPAQMRSETVGGEALTFAPLNPGTVFTDEELSMLRHTPLPVGQARLVPPRSSGLRPWCVGPYDRTAPASPYGPYGGLFP